MTLSIAPVPDAIEVYHRLEAVRNALAPELNDQELQLFALVAQRSGLDPFAKQLYAVKRGDRVTFQTGIDGYRSTAARTREYDGSDEPEFGPMIEGTPPHPEWARVTVYRRRPDGSRLSQSATAWWSEFHPGSGNDSMWKKMPRNQLAKCAEALALRKAFPYVLADIYVTEEMDQAGGPESAPLVEAAVKPTARERISARRVALEQAQDRDAEEPAVMSAPMSEEESDAMPYDEEAETPSEPGLSSALFLEKARNANLGKVAIAGALDVTPDKVTERIRAMDDAGRYRLAQSLGIVP